MLIECPECGKKISDKSSICIGCGYPIKEHVEIALNEDLKFKDENYSYNHKEPTFQISLLDGKDNARKIARYLKVLTNITISEAMSDVAKTPCILFDEVGETEKEKIKTAFEFYNVEFEIKQKDTYIEKRNIESRKVIYLGTKDGKYPDRIDYIFLGRQYNFDFMVDFNEVPFIVRDGNTKEEADTIKNELSSIGVYAQIVDSDSRLKPIVSSLIRPNKTQQQQNTPKCPKCGCTAIQMVPRKFSLLTGFATNKVDRVCVNCKHKW